MSIKAVNPGINWLSRRARANIRTSSLFSQTIAIHTSTHSVQAAIPTSCRERHDASSQKTDTTRSSKIQAPQPKDLEGRTYLLRVQGKIKTKQQGDICARFQHHGHDKIRNSGRKDKACPGIPCIPVWSKMQKVYNQSPPTQIGGNMSRGR